MPEPTAVEQQILIVKASDDCFTPPHYLPVNIDFRDADPYELSQQVIYNNDIVNVVMEQDFKWDGASIPVWWPILPWVVTLALFAEFRSLWVLAVTGALVLYALRLLPYMQKMGLHARAGVVHDKLYRAQKVARVVADAILLSILESDGVPWDVRWLIYSNVRQFGWIAWRQHKRALANRASAAADVHVAPAAKTTTDESSK